MHCSGVFGVSNLQRNHDKFLSFFSEMLNLSQKKLTKNDGQHIVFIVPTVKSAFSLYQHVASSSTRLFVDSSLLFLRVDRQDKMLHKDIIQEILNGKLRKLWKVLFKILIRITRLTLRERGKKKNGNYNKPKCK